MSGDDMNLKLERIDVPLVGALFRYAARPPDNYEHTNV